MASNTRIKFYSKSFGENEALLKSTTEAGSIIFDKTSKAIYVGGIKYGSNVTDATFSSNKLKITKVSGESIEIDFSTYATTSSVIDTFNEIKNFLTMDQSAGTYVAQGDESYVSSDTLTNVNTTNVIDITGSDTDMVDGAIAKVDRKAKSILGEVIVAKKEIDAVETGAGLSEDGSYTANTNTNYIKDATSLKDADEKLDAAINGVSDIVSSLTSGTVSDVKINDTSVKTNGVANITVEGTYNNDNNKIATQTTVSNAIDFLKNSLTGNATIASKSGNSVTLKSGVTESKGVVSNNDGADIILADVASTGAAADVTIADVNNKITATTVEGALTELATSIENNVITIASGEKVISKSAGNELSTTLTMVVEKQGEAGNQKDYIVLKGINDTEITKIDASQFLKDGMLSNAELVTVAEEGVTEKVPYIKLSFNTDAGKQDIRFSILVDTYTSGDTNTLTVSNYTITPVTAPVAENGTALTTGGQVYSAIAATKGQDIQTITGETATTDDSYINVKVTATKDANDDYTLSTTSNAKIQAVTSADASNMGLAEASDVKSYVDTKVGTAVQTVDGSAEEKTKSVTQSNYATVKVSATTDNSNNVTLDSAVGLTIQGVSSASANAMGIAEASDVKSYVDAHTANVTNAAETIPVNSSDFTTLATVDGKDITVKVSFAWEEFE